MAPKIYVGNLPSSIGNETLAEKFSKYGKVYSAKIILDRETNSSMGFAFVEMASSDEAETAILNLNGSRLNGNLINVVEAKNPRLQ